MSEVRYMIGSDDEANSARSFFDSYAKMNIIVNELMDAPIVGLSKTIEEAKESEIRFNPHPETAAALEDGRAVVYKITVERV